MTLKMKFKTREELLATSREELTVHEKVAQETLKKNPNMTLEEVSHSNSSLLFLYGYLFMSSLCSSLNLLKSSVL